MKVATHFTIERGEVFYRGSRFPWRTDYRTVGPDGAVFSGHSSLASLKQLLRQRYGRIEVTVVDGPNWRKQP